MPNYETQSFMLENANRVEKRTSPITPDAEKELLICYLTILDIRDLLFDPNTDLAHDIVDSFIRDVLQPDLSRVVSTLSKSESKEKIGITTAIKSIDDALGVLHETLAKSKIGDPRRVNDLIFFRNRLQQACLQLESLSEVTRALPTLRDVVETSTEKTKTLYFKMDGKAFSDGLELFTTVSTLKEFQYVLDRSYLALSEGKNIRKSDRARYKLVAKNLEQGSLSSVVDIVIDTALPLIAHFGAANIWEYAKSAFDLLKFLYSVRKDLGNKEKPSLTINGSGNNVVINNGEMTISVEKPIFTLANQVRPSYMAIAKLVRHGELDYFQIGSNKEKPEIRLDDTNAKLFDASTEILRYPIKVNCEILSFNKKTGNGKLFAFPNQEIPSDEYAFVVKKRDIQNFIQFIQEDKVVVECRQEILYDPFAPQHTRIVKLRLITAYTI